ncbi:MAG: hypothetical protein OXI74_05785 [Rhodospirillaceae bacterium]|nr:hypothetical protein [Rhodospirillaceae bacterium]
MPRYTGPFPYASDEGGNILLFLGDPVPAWPPLTHLQPSALTEGIAAANRIERELSTCGQEPSHLPCFAFDLAAAEALDKYGDDHYNGSTEGHILARIAARLAAACRDQHHPHVTTCQALKTVAPAAAGQDQDFARRWMTEKRILPAVPRGSLSGPVEHHFLQIAHVTIRDLAGLPPAPDTPPPSAVEARILSRLTHMGAHGRKGDQDEVIGLLGIYGWVKAVRISKTATDTQEFSAMFKASVELMQDVYLSPALSWVRTAYAARIVQRRRQDAPEGDP